MATGKKGDMKYAVALCVVLCCLSVTGAWQPGKTPPAASMRPGFDPGEVARRARTDRSTRLSASLSSVSDAGEFLVDNRITRVPAQFDQSLPAVAFDGTSFLVVWQDQRYGIISGARVTPEGAVLDPAGIVITPAPGDRGAPDVGFDGTNYFVIWEEDRIGTDWDIYGTRVTPHGGVLDPAGIPISTAVDDQLMPALAFDGTNYCVVWEDDRDDTLYNIYCARMTPEGRVLDTAGIPVSLAENDQLAPAVAFDSVGFFLAWEDYRSGISRVYGSRLTFGGAVLDTAGIPISTVTDLQLLPAIAFDGENLLVTWGDFRSHTTFDIYGTRVTPEGAVLDSAGFVISQAANDQYLPALGFDGQDFLVAWADLRGGNGLDIYGARVTPEGAVLDSAGFVVSHAANDQYYPAVALNGANFLLAWGDNRSRTSFDIYAARVTADGGVLDTAGLLISQSANDQDAPSAGFDGTNFLVAWEDDRKGNGWDIYGARVTLDGDVLDPGGFVITEAANDQRLPAVAFDGTDFLVVWEDYRSDHAGDIYGARVTPGGEVLDPGGIAIARAVNDQVLPQAASDGTNSLVVWADYRDSVRFHIRGARVAPDGSVLDPSGITITTVPGVQYAPATAFGGADYLIVWQDTRSGSDWDIYGTRVSPQGTVLDPAGVAFSQAVNNQRFPSIAFNGTQFLLAWQDNRNGSDYDVFGARATTGPLVLDTAGIPIVTAAEDQLLPVVGFDGASYVAVWEDYRNGIDYDIYGARLSPLGLISDSGAIVSAPQDQTVPRLAAGSSGRILLVYRGWAGRVGGEDYNANRVWGEMDPRPSNRRAVTAREYALRSAPVVRGLLYMPEQTGPSRLLDVVGRKVLDLLPGPNDVRSLASGVYFVRDLRAQQIRKIVIVR